MKKSKECRICKTPKTVENFYPSKTGHMGLHYICKRCCSDVARTKRQKNIESGKIVLKTKPPSKEERIALKRSIYKDYLNGLTTPELANKYKMSDRNIACILRSVDVEYVKKSPAYLEKEKLKKEGMKICSVCKTKKSIEEFYPDGNRVRADCADCNAKKVSLRYFKDHEKSKKRQREARAKNPPKPKELTKEQIEKRRERARDKYKNNLNYKEKILKSVKQYRNNPKNRSVIVKTQNRLNKHYKETNPSYRILQNLRRKMLLALNGERKLDFSLKLIGCSKEDLKTHLESQFKEGMSWENYGRWRVGEPMKWHIDHIIPCNTFDFTKEEDQRKCFHYTNLQPLWANENLSKGWKYEEDEKPLVYDWTDWQPTI
jgi:hypothetical protein